MAESIQKTAYFTGVKRVQTLAYFAAFIALGLFNSILGPTLPKLAEHTGSAISEISFLFMARSAGYLLGSLFSGRGFDRFQGHVLLAGILLMTAGMAGLAPVISWLGVLTAVMFFLGAGEGALDVGANLLLVWVHRERSNPFLNALHFFFGIGAFLGPVIVAQSLLYTSDINWAYWVIAIYPLPLVVWFFRLPSPTAAGPDGEEAQGAVNYLLVALIATLFFLYVGAEISFGGWIYLYATTMGLGSETSAAYLASAFWGALTAGRLLAIPVASRLRPRFLLSLDLLGCLLSISLIILFQQSYLVVWVGTIGLGVSMASFFPTTLAYAARRIPNKGSVTRWFFVGSGLGGMVLPWLIGQLFEPLGPRVTMFAILANLLLASLVFMISATFERTKPNS
jgi:FHS family Na+ dependent glucose MFS transporter 1